MTFNGWSTLIGGLLLFPLFICIGAMTRASKAHDPALAARRASQVALTCLAMSALYGARALFLENMSALDAFFSVLYAICIVLYLRRAEAYSAAAKALAADGTPPEPPAPTPEPDK